MPRNREFEPLEALERALTLFWRKGYHATSMSDVVEATGVSRAGIYGEFGSKRELFIAALERYQKTRVPYITSFLTKSSGREGVRAYFEEFLRHAEGDSLGCFVCNTMVEMGSSDAPDINEQISEYLNSMQGAAKGALSKNKDRAGLASLVTLVMLGTVVANQTPEGRKVVKRGLRSALRLLREH